MRETKNRRLSSAFFFVVRVSATVPNDNVDEPSSTRGARRVVRRDPLPPCPSFPVDLLDSSQLLSPSTLLPIVRRSLPIGASSYSSQLIQALSSLATTRTVSVNPLITQQTLAKTTKTWLALVDASTVVAVRGVFVVSCRLPFSPYLRLDISKYPFNFPSYLLYPSPSSSCRGVLARWC
jgi:hypothetical protein